MNDLVKSSGQHSIASIGSGSSVLGQLQPTIPTGGRVRAGIMVLTKAVEKNKKAVELYNAGLNAGTPFNKLAYQIKEACKLQRSPLTPRNVPYFTVRRSDFKVPGNADAMMELYGEIRPDIHPEKQLYRFPVVFPLDNWQGNMPHQFSCYSASERLYWSEYDDTGGRFCMMHAPVEFVGQGQKKQARRSSHGRVKVARRDNDGICSPDDCPEYQNRACTLTGRFLFYVPGIAGSSAIDLPTRSFYALQNARQQMEMMAYITGGRIAGTHNGKALFFISKKNESISMLDPKTGKAKRVSQWIITLEAAVEMTRIFEHQEAAQALADGSQASAALGYDGASDVDDLSSEFDVVGEPETAAPEVVHEVAPPEQEQEKVPAAPEEKPDTSEAGSHAVEILGMIERANSVETVNEALDLARDEHVSDSERAAIQKAAGTRIKEVVQ